MQVKSQELIKLESNIKEAAENLIIATSSLKSCYIEKASSLPEFVELRRLVTNDAKVYSTKILPFSIKVIETIKGYFSTYDKLTLDQFVNFIDNLAKRAENSVQLCDYTAKLHNSLLTDLTKRRDGAIKVSEQLQLQTEYLKDRIEELKRKHKTAKAWAISLAFVPYVNVIASPVVGYVAHDAKKESIAKEREKEMAALAAENIRGPLIESVENFIEAIDEIAKFFTVLASDLRELKKNHQCTGDPSDMELNYILCKADGPKIVSSCNSFLGNIPTCRAELDSIDDSYDQNYVQEWLSKKRNEVKSGKSFIEWGLEIFKSNKDILMLLEA